VSARCTSPARSGGPRLSTTTQPRASANTRNRPDTAGAEQDQPATAFAQVKGLFSLLVAGVGFEPT
jgi:hypothetical protein